MLTQKIKDRVEFFVKNPKGELPEELKLSEEEITRFRHQQYSTICPKEAQMLDWARVGDEVKLNAFRYRDLYMYVVPAPYSAVICRKGNLVVVSEDLQEEIVRQMLEEPNPPELQTELSRPMRRTAQQMLKTYLELNPDVAELARAN